MPVRGEREPAVESGPQLLLRLRIMDTKPAKESYREKERRKGRQRDRRREVESRKKALQTFARLTEQSQVIGKGGLVATKVEFRVYDVAASRYKFMGGYHLNLQLGEGEFVRLWDVVREGVRLWMKGRWDAAIGRFRCEKCGDICG